MLNAKIWIENSPHTGEIKPWKVWFQVENFTPYRVASCKDEKGAEKAKAKAIIRNSEYYNIDS